MVLWAPFRAPRCKRASIEGPLQGLPRDPHSLLRPVGPSGVWPRGDHQTRNVTQPAYPLWQLLPPVPIPFRYCTTQPNATLSARPGLTSFTRLHRLLAFVHLLLFSNHNHSSPRHLRSWVLSSPFPNFREPSPGQPPLSPLSTLSRLPDLLARHTHLDIHKLVCRSAPISPPPHSCCSLAGPELIRTRP